MSPLQAVQTSMPSSLHSPQAPGARGPQSVAVMDACCLVRRVGLPPFLAFLLAQHQESRNPSPQQRRKATGEWKEFEVVPVSSLADLVEPQHNSGQTNFAEANFAVEEPPWPWKLKTRQVKAL
mmetsp:Transcript_103445/g.183772  ORF Transcript_103445/g.183772 Transcript_103445/m.183772 type:complete len:123 (-) Transcript_103445:14-382(-)